MSIKQRHDYNRSAAIAMAIVILVLMGYFIQKKYGENKIPDEVSIIAHSISKPDTFTQFWRECQAFPRWIDKGPKERSGCLVIPKNGYGRMQAVDIVGSFSDTQQQLVSVTSIGHSPTVMSMQQFVEKQYGRIVFPSEKDYAFYHLLYIREIDLPVSDCGIC